MASILVLPNSPDNNDSREGLKWVEYGAAITSSGANAAPKGLQANIQLLRSAIVCMISPKTALVYQPTAVYFRGDVVIAKITNPDGSGNKLDKFQMCNAEPGVPVNNKDPDTYPDLWLDLGEDWIPYNIINTIIDEDNLDDLPTFLQSREALREIKLQGNDKMKAARDNIGVTTELESIRSNYMARANNLSDVINIDQARKNLKIDKDLEANEAKYMKKSENLNDLADKSQALTNIGISTDMTKYTPQIGSKETNWTQLHAGLADGKREGSIVVRDKNGNTYANTAYAVAHKVYLGDLAEYYLSDHNILPGTVVSIHDNPDESELIEFNSKNLAGIVSTEPAIILNDQLGESSKVKIPLALTGRVPLRIVPGSSITPGDYVGASMDHPGLAEVCDPAYEFTLGICIRHLGDDLIEIKYR